MNFKPGSPMDPTVPLWINGKEVFTDTFEPILAPIDKQMLYHYASASVEDCLNAVKAAEVAFKTWSKTTPTQRREILLKASDILMQSPELASQWTQTWFEETGEISDPWFRTIAAPFSAELIRNTAGLIGTAMCGTAPIGMDPSRSAIVSKVPLGVCFACSPWNVPHVLAVRSVIFAIAAGNTVVLKGSETSPKCFWQVGKLFKDAGLPDGVLNIVISRREDSAETVRQIIEHPAVRHVNFTGSSNVGRIIASLAGKALKPCVLELGGKASSIVLEDADIDRAAAVCAASAFMHSGQICMSTERILVHESIADEFAEKLSQAAQALSKEKVPVLASQAGVDRAHRLVSDAVAKGAEVFSGSVDKPAMSGYAMNNVILKGVKKGMDLYYTESFGPQASLYTFKTDQEAIEIANDTEYGLSGAVFSKDLGRAINLAKQIESGAIHINSSTIFDDQTLPHGGFKASGFGRFNGTFGIEQFLQTQTITWVA